MSLRAAQVDGTHWVWRQHWQDLLFMHWRVPADELRSHVPRQLEIDEQGGTAWVSLVLFRLRVRPCWLPAVPGLSTLMELNLRTYVTLGGKPGIYFLSMHADNRLAIRIARLLTPLPYKHAAVRYVVKSAALACDLQSAADNCRLSLSARAIGKAEEVTDRTQAAWLLERYRAFAMAPRDRLLTACVAHEPWRVQPAELSIAENSLGDPFGLNLDRPPDDAHYSRGLVALFSRFQIAEASQPAVSECERSYTHCRGGS
jgi:uncharacterized protein YqjF (DUF2071 family)